MRTLQFTTTHVAQRHSVYKRTLDSFTKHFKGIDFSKSTIYINIDFAPDLPQLIDESQKTIEYLEEIFYKVVPNITKEANFTKAIEWCWTQPDEELFFHLEDDWILEQNVHIDDLLKYFDNDKIFAANLRAYSFRGPRACLLPSVYRNSFCKDFIKTLKYHRNPERQLREYVANTELKNVHHPEDIHEIILKDIGRHWLLTNGLKRNNISNSFIKYSKGQ